MPSKQIPILNDQGIWKAADTVGTNPNYPLFLNGYFEKTDSGIDSYKLAYVKRPAPATILTSGFTAGHYIHGMAAIPGGLVVLYTANNVTNLTWTYLPATGVLTNTGIAPAAAGAWSPGSVYFTKLDGISYGAGNYLAVTDLSKGAVINIAGAWTEIVDVDYTGLNKSTNIEAMDGYLFQATGDNRIYNSDLNTPTSWAALSFLTAADWPGYPIALKRIRNYLILFKSESIEFFENVGNPTPGSPLESRKQLNRPIGCLSLFSVQEVSDGIIFAGVTRSGERKVYKIDSTNLQISEISNRYVEQCLISCHNFAAMGGGIVADIGYYARNGTSLAANQTPVGQSQVIQYNGKEFYAITLMEPNVSKRLTHVFDVDLKVWTLWASTYTTTGVEESYGFIPSQAARTLFTSDRIPQTIFVNNLTNPSSIVSMKETVPLWQDTSGKNYRFLWTSEPFDFGNSKRKFMDSLDLIYSIRSDGTPNPASTETITLRYRDHDYSTAATKIVTRTLPLDTQHGVRCRALRLGNFRRRSITLDYQANTALTLRALEIAYNVGETDQEG
jgi:hypothetical protein